MDTNSQYDLSALSKIREYTHLLVIGNAYLCEEPFLRKFGLALDSHVQKLRGDIHAIKQGFPGQFTQETNTDDILNDIHSMAKMLQNADKALTEKCTTGELGQELETRVNILSRSVQQLKDRVEGKAPSYTIFDSLLRFLRPIYAPTKALASFMGVFFKVLAIIIIIALLGLGYLFFTMESEGKLKGNITKNEALLQSRKDIISEQNIEKEKILKRIEHIMETDPSRQDKIQIMELNVEMNKIDAERQKLEVEISTFEKNIKETRQKLETLKNKTFLKRLLRQ